MEARFNAATSVKLELELEVTRVGLRVLGRPHHGMLEFSVDLTVTSSFEGKPVSMRIDGGLGAIQLDDLEDVGGSGLWIENGCAEAVERLAVLAAKEEGHG